MMAKWTCISVGSNIARRRRPPPNVSDCASNPWSVRLGGVFTCPNWLNVEKNGPSNSLCGYLVEGRLKIVLFCLAILCYANSYEGELVFDDTEAIVNNKDVRGTNGHAQSHGGDNKDTTTYWSLIENDFWGTPLKSNLSHKSWRPLTTLTFRLNYQWSGLDARSYHLVNILLHAIVVLLSHEFFKVILSQSNKNARKETSDLHGNNGDSVGSKWNAAFWASLIFAVHPVHTECVSSIVGRAELLSALFFLVSFLLYVRSCASSGSLYLSLCITCSFLAMLSKEQGITVLGLCILYDTLVVSKTALKRFVENVERRRSDACNNNTEKRASLKDPELMDYLWRQGWLVLACMTMMGVRMAVMGFSAPRFTKVDNPASFHPNILVRFINYNYQYALNGWLLVSPAWLSFDYSMGCIPLILGWTDYRIFIVVTFWSAVAYLIRQSLCNKNDATRVTLQIALITIGVTFLPISNILFRVGFVLAERVLYLPSLGFCLLVGLAISRMARELEGQKKIAFHSVVILFVALFVAKSIQRSKEWRTEYDLFTSGALVCPLNAKVHYNLGIVFSNQGRHQQAEMAYRHALKLNPEYDHAMNNLGNLLKELHRFQEAEVMLEQAVKIRSDFAAAWMNLGIVQASLNKFPASEQSYLTALRLRKYYPDCHFNLGNLYVEQGHLSEALQSWTTATDQKVTHARAWTNIMILYDNGNQCDKAVDVGKKALGFVKDDPGLHFTLANCLGKLERFEEAETHFHAALRLSPQNSHYWANLAVLLHRWKRYKEADTAYRKALSFDPQSVSIAKNYHLLKKVLQADSS